MDRAEQVRRHANRLARAHRAFVRGEISIDPLEATDATWEDENGRLPGETGYVDRLRRFVAVPDLVPDWVLADVEELLEAGYELRKVATEVLPATGCESVEDVEREISRRRAAPPLP